MVQRRGLLPLPSIGQYQSRGPTDNKGLESEDSCVLSKEKGQGIGNDSQPAFRDTTNSVNSSSQTESKPHFNSEGENPKPHRTHVSDCLGSAGEGCVSHFPFRSFQRPRISPEPAVWGQAQLPASPSGSESCPYLKNGS